MEGRLDRSYGQCGGTQPALHEAHREQVRRLDTSASLLAFPLSSVWLPSAGAYPKHRAGSLGQAVRTAQPWSLHPSCQATPPW